MSRVRRRKQKITIATLIVLLVSAFLVDHKPAIKQAATNNAVGGYRVIEFIDGDTITVDMNGSKEKVRMIGVDTPETHDPRKPVQCYGIAASNYTKQLIGTNYVRLEADPINTNRDRYNRLLRYVYLPDGSLVNQEIIKNGYGFAYLSFPFAKADEFRQTESDARIRNVGLWKSCKVSDDSREQTQSN